VSSNVTIAARRVKERIDIEYLFPAGFHLIPKDAEWVLNGCSMAPSPDIRPT
jgi:hypothetical protein